MGAAECSQLTAPCVILQTSVDFLPFLKMYPEFVLSVNMEHDWISRAVIDHHLPYFITVDYVSDEVFHTLVSENGNGSPNIAKSLGKKGRYGVHTAFTTALRALQRAINFHVKNKNWDPHRGFTTIARNSY